MKTLKIIRDGMGNIISSSVMVFFWGLGIFFLYFQMSNWNFNISIFTFQVQKMSDLS